MRLTGFPDVDIRGPRAPWLVGPFPNVMRFFVDPVGRMGELHRAYGPLVALADRNPAMILAAGAALNREVLTQPAVFQNSTELPIRSPAGSALARFNQVLPFTNGEAHKRRRRLLQPAFQRSAIDGYAPGILEVTDRVLDRWPTGEAVDLVPLLRQLTGAITLRTLFGLDALDEREDLWRLESTLLDALSSPLAVVLPLSIPGTPFHTALTTSAAVEERFRRLLAERRASPRGKDALSILVDARDDDGGLLSDEELVGECNGLFVAGYDTSAQTLSWTLLLLALHPAELGAVIAELPDDAPTGETGRLPAVDRALAESMRLLPAAPVLFQRVTAEAATLGGHALPAGATVILSPFLTHRDPERFPEPARFRPDRWLGAEPGAYEYLPFGAGARMCLGSLLGGQLLRIVLPSILQRFVPTLVEGATVDQVTRGIAMAPGAGLPMVLRPRGSTPTAPASWRGNVRRLVATA